MTMIKKILAPTDLSDLSLQGVHYACRLAKELGSELILFHVVSLDESNFVDKREMEEHRNRLAETVKERLADVSAGLHLRQVVEPGQPDTTVLHWAAEQGVDLIVVSSHGRTGLSRVLMGSVTQEILQRASCPVLVVPRDRVK